MDQSYFSEGFEVIEEPFVEAENVTSFTEAITFLSFFQAQTLTYLQDLKDIKQKLRYTGFPMLPYQQKQVKEAEKEANRLFEKLRAKLTNFMNASKGIRYL